MKLARGIRKLAVVAAAGVAMSVLSVAPAYAQGRGGGGPGGGMFGNMFGGGGQMYEPSVSTRDLDSFAQLFGLDATQKDTVKMLFDAYQQQFSDAAKKVRADIDALREEAREARDPAIFQEMGEKSQEFGKARVEMEQSFLNDFKVVLSDEQVQKWPKFERMRRRETTVSRGMMSGERVDLFHLVDDLKLTPEERAPLNEALDMYDVDLDRQLIERNKLYDEMQGKIREFFQDPEGADQWIKKGREASVRVRDVNRKYFAMIQNVLPEAKRDPFTAAFKKESFPQVYRESYAARVVEAAVNLKDLNDDQRSGLAAIKESFYRELANVQKDQETAQEEQEMSFSIAGMMGGRRQGGGNQGDRNAQPAQRGGGGGFFGEDSKTGELRQKRREIENGTVDKIKSLLNEQQAEKLPTRTDNNDGGGRRGGGGDNANQDGGGRRGGGDTGGRRPGRNE